MQISVKLGLIMRGHLHTTLQLTGAKLICLRISVKLICWIYKSKKNAIGRRLWHAYMIKIECTKRSNCTQGFDECDSETEGRLINAMFFSLQPWGGTVVLFCPEKTKHKGRVNLKGGLGVGGWWGGGH